MTGSLALLESRSGRTLLFAFLYMSEGAPIGFLWWALPTLLRVRGLPVEEITTLTSLLVLPWIFKFLWAPLIDRWQTPRWTLRSWILLLQFLMGLTLLPLLFFEDAIRGPSLVVLLLLHALAASTQDAAVDALAIGVTPDHERGALNGWMQAGMLLGRGIMAGGALSLSDVLGERGTILVLVLLIWFPMSLLFATRSSAPVRTKDRAVRPFLLLLKSAFARREAIWGLAFAATAGAGFEAAGMLAGPYLVDRGFNTGEAGLFFGSVAIIAMMTGSLIGGRAADRRGRVWTVALFLILVGASIVAIACSNLFVGNHHWLTIALLGAMYVCVGLFTAASYALFMDLTNPLLGATQFSAYMSGTNVCEAWAGFAAGRIQGSLGYAGAFVVMSGVSLVSLLALKRTGRTAGD
jgi:MFS family permease